jgi:hypothetical protein
MALRSGSSSVTARWTERERRSMAAQREHLVLVVGRLQLGQMLDADGNEAAVVVSELALAASLSVRGGARRIRPSVRRVQGTAPDPDAPIPATERAGGAPASDLTRSIRPLRAQ